VLVLILLLLLPMMLFHYWAQAIGPLPPLLFWLFLLFPLVLFFQFCRNFALRRFGVCSLSMTYMPREGGR
jgi:hypothetical protein